MSTRPPEVSLTEPTAVASVTRYTRSHVLAKLGCTNRTLQRYMAELGPGALDVSKGERGETLYTEEDVQFLRGFMAQKDARARAGMAVSQRERLAVLSATGAQRGGRYEAERLRKVLRTVAETIPSVPKRIRLLMDYMPGLAKLSIRHRVAIYFATYHVCTDLVQLVSSDAPSVWTVERAWRNMGQGE